VNKRALLAEIYAAAKQSIGVPVVLDSAAIAMFRLVLEQYLSLHRLRERIAEEAAVLLGDNPDSRRLMTCQASGRPTPSPFWPRPAICAAFGIIVSS
jgi:hypothetical protein